MYKKLNLGIPTLIGEWKELLSPRYLKEDLIAGISVAYVAVPLSLAIALASGVEPAIGIYTAVVAGIVCALFGGAPLAVSGPAAAIAVLVAANVEQHGMAGVLVMTLFCGVLQLLTGMLGLGRFSYYIPKPVVTGFTAGIAVIILVGQLPRLLGVDPPDQAHVIDVLIHISRYVHETNQTSLAMGLCAFLIMRLVPHLSHKIPAPLIAVFAPTLAVWYWDLAVQTIGRVPSVLPTLSLPVFHRGDWWEFFVDAMAVYFLSSLQSLLSASALDQLGTQDPHDPDQELIGQGLGNISASLIGGIPVAGLIARSAMNLQAGARTRRAAIIHSLLLLLFVMLFPSLIAKVPLAALAGILLSVALGMIDLDEFRTLFRISKHEAVISLITFGVIVFVDLFAGIQAGIGTAALILIMKMGQTDLKISHYGPSGPSRLTLRGSLNFLSSRQLDGLASTFAKIEPGQHIIIDMSDVTQLDSSAATRLLNFFSNMESKSVLVVLKGVSSEVHGMLDSCNKKGVSLHYALTEDDVLAKVGLDPQESVKYRLQHGAELFIEQSRSVSGRRLFHRLAAGQKPHTLLFTCADSRINPNLITSTQPGELFVIRNIGNVIPESHHLTASSVGAAIEYALTYLNIRTIIVCGHSGCGAVDAALKGSDNFNELHLKTWLAEVSVPKLERPSGLQDEEMISVAAKYNVTVQVQRLLSYPKVSLRVEEGDLSIMGWFYDVRHSHIYEWSQAQGTFVSLNKFTTQTLGEPEELQYDAII